MRRKTLKILGLSLVLTAVLGMKARADVAGGGVVRADLLNLRESADLEAAVLDRIPGSSFLLIEEKAGDWYKVRYNGRSGYVSADYVDCAGEVEGSYSGNVFVQATEVRMRRGPGTGSAVVAWHDKGDELKVLGASGEWIKVLDEGGAVGYIRGDLLGFDAGREEDGQTPEAPAPDPVAESAGYANIPQSASASSTGPDAPDLSQLPADAGIGERLVATARGLLGSPYAWGGMSPAGFDCSGFVNYVYILNGYTLDRVANDIYLHDGVSVDKADLQPGDIVCFGSSRYINHVGIYIGEGQFIHSSTYNTGVIVSSLVSGYHANVYVGAKRVVQDA